jgi:hypothetical protein
MTKRFPLSLLLAVMSIAVVAAVAPGPPGNLEASVNGTTVSLTWQAPATGGPASEYILDASLSPGGPVIASYAVTGTTTTVTNVPNGVYYVRVSALNADGRSAPSNEVVVAVPDNGGCYAAPNAPQGLTGSTSNSQVTLSWTAPSGGCDVVSYSVQAGSSPGASDIAVINAGTMTSFSAIAPAGTYYVRVVAVNGFGGSQSSNEVVITVGCPLAPNAPANLTASTFGGAVTLNWAGASSGCAATRYVVQAGSATGLSDLAILDVGSATTLTASAPPGTYYVRVVAANDFGGSAPSNEIVVTVVASGSVTIGFNGLATVADGSPVVSYSESGFAITPTAEDWTASTTFGRPAPFIRFLRQANEGALTGEVTVTSAGSLFGFTSVDVYSSVTPIPLEIIGLRNGVEVFAASGTVPNTFGNFATVSNPYPTSAIDTLVIRMTNPATACCSNPVGLDNIVVVR